jgi:hypothetical protein
LVNSVNNSFPPPTGSNIFNPGQQLKQELAQNSQSNGEISSFLKRSSVPGKSNSPVVQQSKISPLEQSGSSRGQNLDIKV